MGVEQRDDRLKDVLLERGDPRRTPDPWKLLDLSEPINPRPGAGNHFPKG